MYINTHQALLVMVTIEMDRNGNSGIKENEIRTSINQSIKLTSIFGFKPATISSHFDINWNFKIDFLTQTFMHVQSFYYYRNQTELNT